MRHKAFYVVRAQAAGIVEYLYDQTGLTRMGQPLVRLYDLSILSDLRIGESVMARFATSPFVIASRQAGLPPLPPANFPKPTVLQRLLGIRPTLAPTVERIEDTGRGPASAPARGGLTRNSGLAAAPDEPAAESAAPTPAPAPKPVKAPSVGNITRTTGDMTAARERINELNDSLARVETEIGQAKSELAEAREDAAARERLYNQGVLARNLHEAAQRKVRELEGEVASLQAKRADLTASRESALQRLAHLQDQLDEQVTDRRETAAAAKPEPPRKPAPQSGLARPNEPPPTPAAAPRVTAASSPSAFPEPTQPSRPELRRLPRVGGGSSRLTGAREIPSVPMEVKRLASPRWLEAAAPGDGVVVRQLAPEGSQVQPGQPLLEIANREFARVYSDVAPADVAQFRRGAPVRITFDSYPGVMLEGWVNDVQPQKGSGLARVEMVVVAREGYCPEDTYASLEWLVLAAPMVSEDAPEAMAAATDETPVAQAGPTTVYDMMPLVPPQVGPAQDKVEQTRDGEFVGVVRLGEMGDDGTALTAHSSPRNAQRLAKLRQWRDSFTAGMQTGMFGNLALTYPRDTETGQAVERMASARVSHQNNRCARTMREALGWGLGDAAVWLKRLPERGYKPRQDGLARPGDILVWPFTYGPRRSQHIGLAVNQGGKLMLLSNLSGTLGTTELLGGYVAFYKPTPEAAKGAAKPSAPAPAAAARRPAAPAR
jgi:hypothetical protein